MKKFVFFLTIPVIAAFIGACDKVEDPIKPAVLLDTTIFPGNWDDYVEPTFTQNTNTDRNILLEDYTGHRCPNCPAAAVIAKNIEDANPGRVFVASVHAGPGGVTAFQDLATDCGQITNPDGEFCTVFYNDESTAYGQAFASGFNFLGNPQGNISRINFAGSGVFQFSTEWGTLTDQVLSENDLKVNIQAVSNYYAETNGFYLHVETEFLEDLSGGQYNVVTYLIENHTEDWQDDAGTYVEDYEHHNIFRGCIDNLAWGQTIPGTYAAGEKAYFDYSYKLPEGQTNNDFHLLIYVYDVTTYEVLQVIKEELE